jgi:hypothetical protein
MGISVAIPDRLRLLHQAMDLSYLDENEVKRREFKKSLVNNLT